MTEKTEKTEKTKVPCFVCGSELDELDSRGNQPSGGVEFTTYGHYGTAVFDPMDGTQLAVNVCDRCLIEARSRGRVLHVRAVTHREVAYEPWTDEETRN